MKRALAILVLASMACAVPAAMIEPEVLATPTVVPTLTPTVLAAFEPLCLVVSASEALHLRSGPSANTPALAWLTHGEQVLAVGESVGNWIPVEYGALAGWVHADYVEPCDG